MVKPATVDVVIAGGGMVGASLALQLDHYSGGQLRVAVVEPYPVDGQSYQPSFDARSSALSYGSRLIFDKLGIWSQLAQRAAAIDSIHVSERGRFGSTCIDREQVGLANLGYVVDNAWLGEVLLQHSTGRAGIQWYSPASVTRTVVDDGAVQVTIEGQDTITTLPSQLLVVADGAQSGLREQLGIGVSSTDYQQTAVIANVCFSKPHRGCAYERFTDWGPMALLPLTDSERGEPRAALVWTMSADRAEHLCSVDEADFLQQLQDRFGHRQGQFTRVGQRHRYPLQLQVADEQLRRHIVVMGNAAHALHPVAGQGFNLALRDTAGLSRLLVEAHQRSEPLGELALLQQYLDQQRWDQQKTIQFSDRLTRYFTEWQGLTSVLRNLGLVAMDGLPAVKKVFVDHAAGINDGAVTGWRK